MQLATDRPMADVAHACAEAMAAGHDVELAAPAWRRPGLAKAIGVELDAIGPQGGSWRFVAADGADDDLDAGDILGWGPTPVAARTAAAQVPPRAQVELPASVRPGLASSASSPDDAVADMMNAAYAVFAQAQPVMTAGLHPGPGRRVNHGAPASGRSSTSAALAELADLDF
jgi:hypothetical protein